ncbi:ATP synthase F1 subunit gamma [soil metagenome]
MPSLKVVRKRIASVKSTQKITRAMKMVAGARLNRAQQRITALRPYAIKTAEITRAVVATVAQNVEDEANQQEGALKELALTEKLTHPLVAVRPEQTALILLVTSDRGLCGAFNTNVAKQAELVWRAKAAEGKTVLFATIGRKGRDYVTRRGGVVDHQFIKPSEEITTEFAGQVARWITARYMRGEIDSVHVVFSVFKSAMTQIPTADKLLPFTHDEAAAEGANQAEVQEYIFEPDRDRLLERLIPMYLQMVIYRAMLESMASELGARMTAMDAATNNAKDMISKLTLVYNRARQAAITKELMEIIGGAEALKE